MDYAQNYIMLLMISVSDPDPDGSAPVLFAVPLDPDPDRAALKWGNIWSIK